MLTIPSLQFHGIPRTSKQMTNISVGKNINCVGNLPQPQTIVHIDNNGSLISTAIKNTQAETKNVFKANILRESTEVIENSFSADIEKRPSIKKKK